jgi:putative transposase
MARSVVEGGRTNIRHACQTFEVSQTCYRYQAKACEENARIADWLVRLTTAYRDWGFSLCFLHLRNVKGFGWNHKRVYRIYRELELNLRIKPRKRLVRERPEPLAVPDTYPQKIAALTQGQINAAIRTHLDPAKMVLVKAGTFAKP